jgi:hypothetical protein
LRESEEKELENNIPFCLYCKYRIAIMVLKDNETVVASEIGKSDTDIVTDDIANDEKVLYSSNYGELYVWGRGIDGQVIFS